MELAAASSNVSNAMSFFSREELLGEGLPARRAGLLLFAIENRTAQLIAQGHRDTAVYMVNAGIQTREQEFFAALRHARGNAAPVTIQQIERYAAQWRSLLPETPDAKLNAALAQLIGAKYKFTRAETPNLRAALVLDDAATQQYFQKAYGKTLDTIYAPQIGWSERARFGWAHAAARLEALPPFWLAFLLTMPGAAGLLALPIALAGVGVVGGVMLLIAFALINMFTAAALAEATARGGVTRLGLGWLGQLVQEYLGGAGALFLTIILAINNVFVLAIFYLGVGGTLEQATQLPAGLWMVLLFGVCVYFLSRGSINSTIASTLLIIFGVVLLLVVIPLFAVPYFRVSNLTDAPPVSFNLNALQFALGLLLSTYFSHLLVVTYAPVIVRRDVSGRSWVWGSAAAIFGFMLIAIFWFIVLNGAVSAFALANAQGTALIPLAEKAGPIVLWLGSLLVILSLGLATVQITLALYYMVQERLPRARAGTFWAKPRARFLISLVPLVAIVILAEWLAVTGASSFANLLGISSAFALPLLSGVFPLLLLASTRRKGEFVPRGMHARLTHPFVLMLGYIFFVGMIFAYGLFLFQDTLIRLAISAVAVVTVLVTFMMLRRGMLTPRLVIQVRAQNQDASYALVENGAPLNAQVQVNGASSQHNASGALPALSDLRALVFVLPVTRARLVKILTYQQAADAAITGLAGQAKIETAAQTRELKWNATDAGATCAVPDAVTRAEIVLNAPEARIP